MVAASQLADPDELLASGAKARREHRFTDAKDLYRRALDLSRERNDVASQAKSLARLGGIERDLGDTEAALELYQQAVALFRTLDIPLDLAHAVRHVGDIALELKQLPLAEQWYKEALSIYRSHPGTGTLDLANTLRGYALLKSAMGQTDSAIDLWREAGSLYGRVWQEPGSPFTEADLAPGVAECRRQVETLSAR